MTKPPAFQFYADDFLAGTMLMTDSEVGKYIRALCIQWNRGGLSTEDFARLGLTMVEPGLDSGSSMVATKFQLDSDGLWKNERLEQERIKQQLFRDLQSEKGKASAKARFNRGSTVVQPSGVPKVNSPSPSPSPSPVGNILKEQFLIEGQPGVKQLQKPSKRTGTLDEVREVFKDKGLPESDANYFFHKMESSGWTVGGQQVKQWKSVVSSWFSAKYFPSQKQLSAPKPTPKGPVFGRDFT